MKISAAVNSGIRLSSVFAVALFVALCPILLTSIGHADATKLATPSKESGVAIKIHSKTSALHLGSLDSFDITPGGKNAAKLLLDAITNGHIQSAKDAIHAYDVLIPDQNFGGEFTALRWIAKLQVASPAEQKTMLADPTVSSWYQLLARDHFAQLQFYINRKYHFIQTGKYDTESKRRLRFLEDFILFGNPARELWEKSSKIIASLNIKNGEDIADLGSGPGYYTFKFSKLVGRTGKVYAIETNPEHIKYLNSFIKKYKVGNVVVTEGSDDSIGLNKGQKVDLVYMCSFYHIVYGMFSDGLRDLFIHAIKNSLKPDGRLVVVDNDLVENKNLPYHGPYISRELIASQLRFYGFELTAQHQYLPQRYILEFKLAKSPAPVENASAGGPCHFIDPNDPTSILVTSRSSLLRYHITGGPGFTIGGKKAARLFMKGLMSKKPADLEAALSAYRTLEPVERIGSEYTAIDWLCQVLLASPDKQAELLSNNITRDYYEFWAHNDFQMLKKYIRLYYDLDQPDPKGEVPQGMDPDEPARPTRSHAGSHRSLKLNDKLSKEQIHDVIYHYRGHEVSDDQLTFWFEFMTFNNPNRQSWENTSKLLDYVNVKPGETIADIGCGAGYYSFKFADAVGSAGHVFATDLDKDDLAYIDRLQKTYNLPITTVVAKLNDACLQPNSVDDIFLCSVWDSVYVTSIEFVKDAFLQSMKKALKPGGRLIIVDNSVIPDGAPEPYFGPGMAKELIIAQLHYYGFHCVGFQQIVPQRYVLIFQAD